MSTRGHRRDRRSIQISEGTSIHFRAASQYSALDTDLIGNDIINTMNMTYGTHSAPVYYSFSSFQSSR